MWKKIIIWFMVAAIPIPAALADEEGHSGFLGNYQKMRPAMEQVGVLYEANQENAFGQYHKIMITDVTVQFHPDVKDNPVMAAQVKELAIYFKEETIKSLPRKFELTEEPGQDVIVLRLGLTDVVPYNSFFKADWNTEKPGFGINHATIEVDFNLATTGERVFALIDQSKSKRLEYLTGSGAWWHTNDILLRWKDLLNGEIVEKHDYYR